MAANKYLSLERSGHRFEPIERQIVSNTSLNVSNKLLTLMSLLSGIYLPPLDKQDDNLCVSAELTCGWTASDFEKYKLEVKSHHYIFLVSAGGKSRSAAEFLLMVYHLQESLSLRRIGLNSAQTKLAAFHQRISRRHEESRHSNFRT
ncbi:hypothetical protein [Lapidilactobacillus bayanensis]|uniref:hypothetical protein n=1 Tax=Lapidilactobacillus bayanensis TaxID=2485998 RepID=UPI000F7A94CF|nr:hypothetical protein [Lapidilactobacillus bayanensis]